MSKISARQFLDCKRIGEGRWRLAVADRHTGGRGSLFGGVGLAAAICVLEQETDAPVVWATAQYISRTPEHAEIDFDVRLPAVGRSVTQGQVTGHLGEQQVISVLAALGDRREWRRGLWDLMPRVPAPEQCALVVREEFDGGTIHEHNELRLARGMFGFTGDGEPTCDEGSLLWVRMNDVRHDRSALAILADYMPSAVGNALGERARVTSLDNTIRFADADASAETEWILLDNRIEFIGNGFATGTCLMWSPEGTLLATASQSMLVAPFPAQ